MKYALTDRLPDVVDREGDGEWLNIHGKCEEGDDDVTDHELPTLRWNTCEIYEEEAKRLLEEEPDKYENIEAAREAAYNDQDLLDFEYDSLAECLTEWMNEINPEGQPWFATVENFGWDKRSGHKVFRADNGRTLLRETLPNTECTYTITRHPDHLHINNAHHDRPTGGEIYIVRVAEESE